MDQPTAEQALKEMEVLIGEWSQMATPAGGEPWPGEAQASFEWLEGGQLLLERSTVEMPEAPDGVRVYGCDAANLTYYQLYTDDRNVCRIFEMSIGNGEWKLWREGEHMMKLRRALADPFTVYLPDRRGRGMSGAFGPA
jgi:hypothetical protein